jgi:hypothetical protein
LPGSEDHVTDALEAMARTAAEQHRGGDVVELARYNGGT